MQAELMRRIGDRPVARCPSVNLRNSAGKSRWGEGIIAEDMKAWRSVEPTVVVEIGLVEWTAEALRRHSTFVGIRDDKRAFDVHREP